MSMSKSSKLENDNKEVLTTFDMAKDKKVSILGRKTFLKKISCINEAKVTA